MGRAPPYWLFWPPKGLDEIHDSLKGWRQSLVCRTDPVSGRGVKGPDMQVGEPQPDGEEAADALRMRTGHQLARPASPEAGAADRLVSDSFTRAAFTLDQIRTFLVVAGREHVTQAAVILNLSQSAVTQQVRLFEKALGVQLIERVGRNIRLTDPGVEVAGACLLIMRGVENLHNAAYAARELEAGLVAVGASEVTAAYHLPQRLVAFAAEHPAVQVCVSVGDATRICERVAAGDLDCALVDVPSPKRGLTQIVVALDEVLLAVSANHELVGVDPVRVRQLTGRNYVMWDSAAATESTTSKALGVTYSRLQRVQLPNLEAVRQCLLSGAEYIATMPRTAVADDLRRGALVRLPVKLSPLRICAIRRPSPAGPAADAFWRQLSFTGKGHLVPCPAGGSDEPAGEQSAPPGDGLSGPLYDDRTGRRAMGLDSVLACQHDNGAVLD